MAAVLSIAGCAQHKPVAKVNDSGPAHPDENQTTPLDEARAEEGRAGDAAARASAAEADARARLEVAKSEREVADAQVKRSSAERDLLKKQAAPRDQQVEAEEEIQSGSDRLKAAALKIKYLEQLAEAVALERQAAEAHVATAHAATEKARRQARKSAEAPQAGAAEPGEVDQELEAAQGREAELQKQAGEQRSAAVSLYDQWQQADSRVRTIARPTATPPAPEPAPSK
jgi:hypothetical protein